ncbi:MAG: hypothetical protein ACOZNI_23475 [Myxococcota bacterium]
MWWVGLAVAQDPPITLSRDKESVEAKAPEEITPEMSSVEADAVFQRELFRRRAVARWAATDEVFRWELAAVEACAATTPATGDVVARFKVDNGGTVTKVSTRSGDPALAACVREGFTDVRLPLTQGGLDLTYTLRFSPAPRAAPPPPPLDRDRGAAGLPWGANPADLDGLQRVDGERDTTFYQRDTDYEARLMGVPVAGISYGFDPHGLYVVIVRVLGDDGKFNLRQALRARYGQGRLDPQSQAEYWRGQKNVIEARDAGDALIVTFLDIERGRRSGLVTRLPGDKTDDAQKEVPRYLRKSLEEKAAEPTPP